MSARKLQHPLGLGLSRLPKQLVISGKCPDFSHFPCGPGRTVYGGEEEDSDWPQGCYEIAGGSLAMV